jgi:hypothetical protein
MVPLTVTVFTVLPLVSLISSAWAGKAGIVTERNPAAAAARMIFHVPLLINPSGQVLIRPGKWLGLESHYSDSRMAPQIHL